MAITNSSKCDSGDPCVDGLILPAWLPPPSGPEDIVTRAVVYLLILVYLLFGLNILTDSMLTCITVITSQKRTKIIKLKNGGQHKVQVKFLVFHQSRAVFLSCAARSGS